MPSYSIVVPVFNGARTLDALVERLSATLEPLEAPYEILLVNDGSRDESWSVIRALAERYPFVRGVDLTRNYGQHNALLCGIRAARHDVVVTIDDDLQNPPEEVPKLLAEVAAGRDVVYGVPEHLRHGLMRNLASQITKHVLQAAMGAEIARNVSAFRAFRTELRTAFERYSGPTVSIDVLLTWATSSFGAVRVRHDARAAGASNYTARKLVEHGLNLVTGFSTIPLQLASVVGFGFTLFGMGVLALVLARYVVEGGVVPGFPFLASIIAIFAGAQLFALGIIGEYLARIYQRSMRQPSYTIRTRVGDDGG